MNIKIRKAAAEDYKCVFEMIKKLMEFEGMQDMLTLKPEDLKKALENEEVFALLAFDDDKNLAVGAAVYHFRRLVVCPDKKTVYLEELYIDEDYRRFKIGSELFKGLKSAAREHGAGKIEWKCLDWNENAAGFYKNIGAETEDKWISFYLNKF